MAMGLRKDHDELEKKHNSITERVGRVEESTKAADSRIDSIEMNFK
jgi:chaperonin cofactor prefoldin